MLERWQPFTAPMASTTLNQRTRTLSVVEGHTNQDPYAQSKQEAEQALRQIGWQRNVGQIGGGGQLVHSSSIAQTVAVASS